MNDNIIHLRLMGCETTETMKHFLDDDILLVDCIRQVLNDPAFDSLEEGLKRHDTKIAFEAAHTLKGVCANTELSPLLNEIVPIVEMLRKGCLEGVDEMNEHLRETRDSLKEQMRQIK